MYNNKKVEQNNYNSGGVGVAGLLGVAFVVLKLVGVIDWPWIWVLSPFWIPVAFAVLIVVIAVLVAAVNALIVEPAASRKRQRIREERRQR